MKREFIAKCSFSSFKKSPSERLGWVELLLYCKSASVWYGGREGSKMLKLLGRIFDSVGRIFDSVGRIFDSFRENL